MICAVCTSVTGKSRVLVLDAEKRTTEFWGAAVNDITMRQTIKDLHSCAAYEKSCLRALQRIQRNSPGEYYSYLIFSLNNRGFARLTMLERNKRATALNDRMFYLGIDITNSANVRVRELRCAIVWRSISEMQWPDDHETRGLRRCVHEEGVRDEDETASGAKRELSVHISTARLVSIDRSINPYSPFIVLIWQYYCVLGLILKDLTLTILAMRWWLYLKCFLSKAGLTYAMFLSSLLVLWVATFSTF